MVIVILLVVYSVLFGLYSSKRCVLALNNQANSAITRYIHTALSIKATIMKII